MAACAKEPTSREQTSAHKEPEPGRFMCMAWYVAGCRKEFLACLFCIACCECACYSTAKEDSRFRFSSIHPHLQVGVEREDIVKIGQRGEVGRSRPHSRVDTPC